MKQADLEIFAPGAIQRYILHFEASLEEAVSSLASTLPPGSRVLDAGAGEGKHKEHFGEHRYCGVDLAVGDPDWDYRKLDAIADLTALPFRAGSFDACLNIVTLEHVREPATALREMFASLKPGGVLLLVVPHEWEVHQAPNDYFRFTCHGIRYLLEKAGFTRIEVEPVGGCFRLLSRRLLNSLQYFPDLLFPVAAMLLAPLALILPGFDSLDRERDFTLGYICTARKPS